MHVVYVIRCAWLDSIVCVSLLPHTHTHTDRQTFLAVNIASLRNILERTDRDFDGNSRRIHSFCFIGNNWPNGRLLKQFSAERLLGYIRTVTRECVIAFICSRRIYMHWLETSDWNCALYWDWNSFLVWQMLYNLYADAWPTFSVPMRADSNVVDFNRFYHF